MVRAGAARKDIKKLCVAQALYLLPASDTRVKMKALSQGKMLHEFLLDAVDRAFLAPGRMESAVWDLRGAGLAAIEYGSPDLLRPTELGVAFLGLLDPSGNDPGVLGRWRDPETGVVPQAAVPDMDAWLAGFFGRTKEGLLRLGPR